MKIKKVLYLVGVFLLLLCTNVTGQTKKDAFQTARSLAFAGEYQKSIKICDSIIKKQPKNFDVRILQARVFAWNKQLDSSRTKCKQLNSDFPKIKAVYVLWGVVERWDKEYQTSLDILSEGLQKHKQDQALMYEYAQTLKANKEYVTSITWCDSIVKLHREALNANELKISLLTTIDSTRDAKVLADSLIKIYPKNPNLRILRSKNWCAQNLFDTAYCDVDTGFGFNESHLGLHHQNTNIPLWDGKNDTAIAHAEKGLEFHPKDPVLKTLLAKAFLRLDSLPPCDSICAVLLKEDSLSYDVWGLVLNSQLSQQNYDSVLAIVAKLDTIYPQDEELIRFKVLSLTEKKKFKKAIKTIEQGPKPIDSLDINTKLLYAKLHFWDRQTSKSLNLTNRFIEQHPKEPSFYAHKARIQKGRYEKKNALNTIDEGLAQDSLNAELKELRLEVEALKMNQLGGFLTYDIWSNAIDPSFNRAAVTAEYLRRIRRHVVVGRLTVANRFDSTGVQFEVDAYPVFTDWLYAYANIGVSNNFLFPGFRAGFEPFVSLPANFEASLGFRYLLYLPNDDVTILTGSIANYPGNFWISFRPYFNFRPAGVFQTYTLQGRYFFKDPLTYIEGFLGTGSSPDNAYLDPVFTQNVESTSYNVGLGYQQKLSKSLHGKAWVIYDQYFPQQIADFNIISLNLGLWWRF